jgi:F-type H+-transporting ATPase subunit gamma
MQKLQTIQRKIGSAEDMQSVVKTMKSLAAVNIRQYEEAVHALREYADVIELGIQAALRMQPWALRRMRNVPAGAKTAAVVYGSEQGMAGQFNEQIARYAVSRLRRESESRDIAVIAVGDRVASQMADEGLSLYERLAFPGSIAGVNNGLFQLVSIIETLRFSEQFDHIVIFHNTPTSGASFTPARRQLLPLNPAWLDDIGSRAWPTRMVPQSMTGWEPLFADLVREIMYVSLMRAYIESLASENASRLSSMQVAEKNIEERLDQLRQQFNRQRQSSITAELLDIVAGFEALANS